MSVGRIVEVGAAERRAPMAGSGIRTNGALGSLSSIRSGMTGMPVRSQDHGLTPPPWPRGHLRTNGWNVREAPLSWF